MRRRPTSRLSLSATHRPLHRLLRQVGDKDARSSPGIHRFPTSRRTPCFRRAFQGRISPHRRIIFRKGERHRFRHVRDYHAYSAGLREAGKDKPVVDLSTPWNAVQAYPPGRRSKTDNSRLFRKHDHESPSRRRRLPHHDPPRPPPALRRCSRFPSFLPMTRDKSVVDTLPSRHAISSAKSASSCADARTVGTPGYLNISRRP